MSQNVCSIYLSPSSKFNINDFDNLITQLPPPILLLGDFNAHSSLWGCSKTDARGKLIEDILLKHNLSLLNDGSYTYLHPATGSSSAIDLSIATPSLYLDFSWRVISDQHGSSHFPIRSGVARNYGQGGGQVGAPPLPFPFLHSPPLP